MNQKGIFTIPLSSHFLEDFSKQIIAEILHHPIALRDYTIFLPTQRAIRELKKLLIDLYGRTSLILPKIIALGEVSEEDLSLEEIPSFPSLSPLKRHFLLTKLIQTFGGHGYQITTSQAFKMASDLMGLIDQVILEDLNFQDLKGLVVEQYAQHWQITLDFLRLITDHWPKILQEESAIEAALVKKKAITTMIAEWTSLKPTTPFLIAGSTGSMKLTRCLMRALLELPQGRVILPGFEKEDYETALSSPAHPQHTMSYTLHELKISPEEVLLWPASCVTQNTTLKTLQAALRPTLEISSQHSLPNVHKIDCANELEEASVIALILRESLEIKDLTSLLVTPDRTLARRVASCLRRWDIKVDDSSGKPLSETSVGILMRLCAEFILDPDNPITVLSFLKHPFIRFKHPISYIKKAVRKLETTYLRGNSSGEGLIKTLLEQVENSDLKEILNVLYEFDRSVKIDPFHFPSVLKKQTDFLKELTQTETKACLLDTEEGGVDLNNLLTNIFSYTSSCPNSVLADYSNLLIAMMNSISVRSKLPSHPRIAILGPLEARLITADRVILAGLNEGTWPLEAETGPWLSRPMRVDFGLQPLEQRIGLSAHDFMRAFAAKEIYLTRSLKVQGTPTIPCRWVLRLEALLGNDQSWLKKRATYIRWSSLLDSSFERIIYSAPEPRPPVHKRPRILSVTQIETWMRDPYAIYAHHVLKLKKLDPLQAELKASDRGTLIHRCLERYKQENKATLKDLISIGEQEFYPFLSSVFVSQFWWARFLRLAEWFVEQDQKISPALTHTEIKGQITLGDFTLTAKADRIDIYPDGRCLLIDYKTGKIPEEKAIKLGYACQLPLEGLIMKKGGFKIESDALSLQFWGLTGKEIPGEIKPLKETEDLIQASEKGLLSLIALFDQETTPYRSQPQPTWEPLYSDYEHLARIQEWSHG